MNQLSSKIFLKHWQVGYVSIEAMENDALMVTVALRYRFLVTREEVKLIEDLATGARLEL